MKKSFKILSIILSLIIFTLVFGACTPNDTAHRDDTAFIKVGDRELDKEYVGYFFHIAKMNMIQEAGMVLGEGGNSTEEDVKTFWETTEIEGRSAEAVARNLAADNAVIQTVQYLKAVDEGIKLIADEERAITEQINSTIESVGGRDKFNSQLKSMGCDANAYRQILTENRYVQKLYDKYDSDGKLSVSDTELEAYSSAHEGEYKPEHMFDYAKKDKFNKMASQWKNDYKIEISDKKMDEFKVINE